MAINNYSPTFNTPGDLNSRPNSVIPGDPEKPETPKEPTTPKIKITDDPWGWAKANPWAAAGGIAALTGLLGTLNNNNNRGGNGLNIGGGILAALLGGGLTFALLKGIPWFKEKYGDISSKLTDTVNNANETMNSVKNASNSVEDAANNANKVISYADRNIPYERAKVRELEAQAAAAATAPILTSTEAYKRKQESIGKPITSAATKVKDPQTGATVPQWTSPDGEAHALNPYDVSDEWIPEMDANGNIIRYRHVNDAQIKKGEENDVEHELYKDGMTSFAKHLKNGWLKLFK